MKTVSSILFWLVVIAFWVAPLVVCYLWGKARGRLAEKREQEARLTKLRTPPL